jgi:anaerobic magnesium-protoporphyrin IX monomethyl ester cyclase
MRSRAHSGSVLLVNPPGGRSTADMLDGDKFIAENIGIGYLAAYLRQSGECGVQIVDAYLHDMAPSAVADFIVEARPLLVGFAISYHPALEGVRQVVDELNARGWQGMMIAGGNHASLAAGAVLNVLPEIAAIVHGDGEETIVELVAACRAGRPLVEVAGLTVSTAGGPARTFERRLIRNLDALPAPARDTLPYVLAKGGVPYISSSRGCYARCKFCTITSFYGSGGPRWRGRSGRSIADEVTSLVAEYGVERLFFVDDNFMGPGRKGKLRGFEVADALKAAGQEVAFSIQTRSDDLDKDVLRALRSAGLRVVFLGLESGSQSALDFYQKDNTVAQNIAAVDLLRSLELAGIYGLIMFNPKTDWEQFFDSMHFLRRVRDYNLLWIPGLLRNLPGAEFEHELGHVSTFIGADGFSFFQIEDSSIRNLAQFLGWVMAPAAQVLSRWEEVKWAVHMQFQPKAEDIASFRQASDALQDEALDLLTTAADIIERAWRSESRLAGPMDLVEQRAGFAELNDRFRPIFGSTRGRTNAAISLEAA